VKGTGGLESRTLEWNVRFPQAQRPRKAPYPSSLRPFFFGEGAHDSSEGGGAEPPTRRHFGIPGFTSFIKCLAPGVTLNVNYPGTAPSICIVHLSEALINCLGTRSRSDLSPQEGLYLNKDHKERESN
jgi:hypothetical protein